MLRTRVGFGRGIGFRKLVFTVLIAIGMMLVGSLRADDAAPTAPVAAPTDAAAQPAGPTSLQQSVKDFWFYGKVARYDLANIEGQKILNSGAQPREVLEAFDKMLDSQSTLNRQKDNLDEWMLRWANLDAMKDITLKIQDVLNQGYLTRKSDPDFIRHEIERLSINQRAYQSAMRNLRQSGELAVPFMLNYLRDPSKAQYQALSDSVMRRSGQHDGLNALVAATLSTNGDELVAVIGALGDIGYDAAVPYLARVANDPSLPAGAHDAATKALAQLNITGPVNVADAFDALAEKQKDMAAQKF